MFVHVLYVFLLAWASESEWIAAPCCMEILAQIMDLMLPKGGHIHGVAASIISAGPSRGKVEETAEFFLGDVVVRGFRHQVFAACRFPRIDGLYGEPMRRLGKTTRGRTIRSPPTATRVISFG